MSPKNEGDKSIRDFHPINLLYNMYKILAKALANRLKVVLGNLVFEFQIAGVERRSIQGNILVANELIDSGMKCGEPRVVFKLDFTKAFDHVSWEFLAYLLGRFGFGEK